jgi:predicted enzyme related to lactoylglutathione lyase
MFGPVRGAWPDEKWTGWWGENPPCHTPVFVLTHHSRPSITMKGGTTFHSLAHVPPNWQIYFRVPDITSAVERITANGGRILNGPMEVPGGDWVVNAMDPQGAAFALHARKKQ